MNNVLITIGVLIVIVLGALFAIPQIVDWNAYRGVIEEEASRITGRDVRIGGEIKLQLLPSPSFVIRNLRVADVASGTGEPMFRADRVDARLSVVPLVRGVLEANEIELVRPVLRLVLDEAGRGNWRNFGHGNGTLPFVPNDVALQSVRITDGTLSVHDRNGLRERLVLGHVTGQLSAPALEGPYRFRGSFGEVAQMRDLRVSTTPVDATGKIQVKASLKDVATGASTMFDGHLGDLSSEPRLAGQITAVLPLPGADKSGAKGAPAPAKGAAASTTESAELKSEIVGTAGLVLFKNLSVAFDSSGRPAVLAGDAQFEWGDTLATTARLSAPWLDLDPVFGTPESGSPLFAVADFGQRLNGLAAKAGTVDATIDIEQANLGRDLVNNIRIAAKSIGGVLVLDEVRAGLPGGAHLQVQGRFAGQGAAATFDGDLSLQGTSLSRLAAWGSGGAVVIDPLNDHAFEAVSRVAVEPGRNVLDKIVLRIGDSTIDGAVDYLWSPPPGTARRVSLRVNGARVDARAVLPAKLTLRRLAGLLAPRLSNGKTPSRASEFAPPDVTVHLHLDEIVLPDSMLQGVTVGLSTGQDGVTVERVQFSAGAGVAVSVGGKFGTEEQVELTGSVTASTAADLASVMDFLDVPANVALSEPWASALVPLRVAGSFARGRGAASTASIVADGQVGVADAKIRIALDRGLDGWRSAPSDFDVVLLAPRRAELARRVLAAMRGVGQSPAQSQTSAEGAPLNDTRLAIRAGGRLDQGLVTQARYDSTDATVFFRGKLRENTAGRADVSGDMVLDSRDGRDLAIAWTGLDFGMQEPLPLSGTARLDLVGARSSVAELSLRIGKTADVDSISGGLISETSDAGRTKVSGALALSSLDAVSLLAPILKPLPRMPKSESGAGAETASWPQRGFDYSRMAAAEVSVALSVDKLKLPGQGHLANARLNLLLRPDALELRDMSGTALGGAAQFSAVVKQAPAGATATARLDLTGASLEAYGASGTLAGFVQVEGQGGSPAGLIASASGNGTLQLQALTVNALAPETLLVGVAAALKGPPEAIAATVRSTAQAASALKPIALGTRTVPLTVQAGVARADPVVMSTSAGTTTGITLLDLSTLAVSGEWRVGVLLPLPAGSDAASILLPALIKRFVVSPQDAAPVGATRPALETDELDKELAVRKVERDLAELERLRRLDEERAAQAAKVAVPVDPLRPAYPVEPRPQPTNGPAQAQ